MINYKKYIYLTIFIFVISLDSNAQANDKTQTIKLQQPHAKELAGLFERKVLRVAMYKRDTPPFYFVNDENELTGVDVEIIKGFARRLGLEVEFIRHANTLDEVINIVAQGEADLAICKLSITFSRATKVLFTEPYIMLRKGLLVNRVLLQQQLSGRHKKEVIQQLKGTLGVIGNSSYVNYAKQRFNNMKIKEYSSWKEVVDAVLSQQIIAGFRDEAEIKKVILDNKDRAINLLTVVLEDDFDPKGIAIPSHANYLKALLDFYIDSIGLKLTANSVLFEYDSVIDHLNRYDITKVNN
ncbi:transporter substrate-binding domain-containing protein [uncultured Psychrosphaera sp.]|uniref:substrate-binding periplasmic protein n=1 Tax=uncultured Psychrosphaera sp. TaxID=1403522 RepID=UPI0026365CDD|nr:transporter substrate-binding domain-containing protein [uncultured Psychrosphaera sp.]